jgi:hypothetical protein
MKGVAHLGHLTCRPRAVSGTRSVCPQLGQGETMLAGRVASGAEAEAAGAPLAWVANTLPHGQRTERPRAVSAIFNFWWHFGQETIWCMAMALPSAEKQGL